MRLITTAVGDSIKMYRNRYQLMFGREAEKPQEDAREFHQGKLEQELKHSRAPDGISRGTPHYRQR